MSKPTLTDQVTAFCLSVPRTKPVLLGITGPQGCGKSTLAGAVVSRLDEAGLHSVAVSIDDFYLTNSEQQALSAGHPSNPYIQHRGYPGTHDVALGTSVLDALTTRTAGDVRIPVYDKGAKNGRGDRAPETQARRVRTPLDIVLLEGWMLGFRRVPDEEIDDPHLSEANALLPAYDAWLTRVDALVHLDAVNPASVVRWRVDAEQTRRNATGVGLSDDDARDYIERFLPAYRTYVPALRNDPPVAGPHLHIALGDDRLPVSKADR